MIQSLVPEFGTEGAETGSNFAVCHPPNQVGRAPTSNIHASHEPRDMLENRIDDARAVIGTFGAGGIAAALFDKGDVLASESQKNRAA